MATKTKSRCDPTLRRELDKINAELNYEDFLSDISEEFEALQLCQAAKLRGEAFGDGFLTGFIAGQELRARYDTARAESIRQKHEALNRRWGLLDL